MKRRHFLNLAVTGLFLANVAVKAQEIPPPMPRDDPFPACESCVEDGYIGPKNETIEETFCSNVWGQEAPRRWYVGRCLKYRCATGTYYVFDGWYPLPVENCTASVIKPTVPLCPNANCLYVPGISDPWPVQGHMISGQANTWDCPSRVRNSVTPSQASEFIRQVMKEKEH